MRAWLADRPCSIWRGAGRAAVARSRRLACFLRDAGRCDARRRPTAVTHARDVTRWARAAVAERCAKIPGGARAALPSVGRLAPRRARLALRLLAVRYPAGRAGVATCLCGRADVPLRAALAGRAIVVGLLASHAAHAVILSLRGDVALGAQSAHRLVRAILAGRAVLAPLCHALLAGRAELALALLAVRDPASRAGVALGLLRERDVPHRAALADRAARVRLLASHAAGTVALRCRRHASLPADVARAVRQDVAVPARRAAFARRVEWHQRAGARLAVHAAPLPLRRHHARLAGHALGGSAPRHAPRAAGNAPTIHGLGPGVALQWAHGALRRGALGQRQQQQQRQPPPPPTHLPTAAAPSPCRTG